MNLRSITALACVAALAACSGDGVQSITAAPAGASIKFFNFGVNTPGVNFYANSAKITAIGSTTGAESTTGTIYGGVGNSGSYSAIAPGQYTLSGKIAAATDKDLDISSVSTTLVDGKFYSMFISGIYDASAKKVEAFVVEDVLPTQQNFTASSVRFVNAISNSGALTLSAKNTSTGVEVPVGGATAYKGASAFAPLPLATYDLIVRTAAGTTVLTRTAVVFGGGFISGWTVTVRGDITVVSTTAATRPILDVTLNR